LVSIAIAAVEILNSATSDMETPTGSLLVTLLDGVDKDAPPKPVNPEVIVVKPSPKRYKLFDVLRPNTLVEVVGEAPLTSSAVPEYVLLLISVGIYTSVPLDAVMPVKVGIYCPQPYKSFEPEPVLPAMYKSECHVPAIRLPVPTTQPDWASKEELWQISDIKMQEKRRKRLGFSIN